MNQVAGAGGKGQGGAYGMVRIWAEGGNLPRLSAWGMLYQLFCQAVRSIMVTPVVSVVTVITIALALFLFATFVLFMQNVGEFLSSSQSEHTLNLYLRDSAVREDIDGLLRDLKALPQVEDVEYHDKAAALEGFREALGDQSDVLEGLEGQNPLPASLEVRFRKDDSYQGLIETVAGRFSQRAAVEHVQYSAGVISQLGMLIGALKVGGTAAILVMVVLISSIISNTIKLALFSRNDELQIMKLVGATGAFIRTPCLIEGSLQGLAGAILGIIALYFGYLGLARTLARSDVLRVVFPQLHFLSPIGFLLVAAVGILVGVFGSYFAVRPFLND